MNKKIVNASTNHITVFPLALVLIKSSLQDVEVLLCHALINVAQCSIHRNSILEGIDLVCVTKSTLQDNQADR